MRQLVIHAGLPKTGSSALQVALARHGEFLARQGVFYPELGSVALAKAGAITSGNGASVAAFLNGNDNQKVSVENCFRVITGASQQVALLSSELFYSARPDRLADFIARFREAGFRTRIVFFVRSLYEWAWSAYVQNVKNHGVSAQFAGWIVSSNIADAIPSTVRKFQKAVDGGEVVLLNYDTFRDDVFAAFAEHALRAESPPPGTVPVGRVNRSLSTSEIEALRAFNLVRRGRPGGQQLSDALIQARPHLEVPVAPLIPPALELLREKYDAVEKATAGAIGGPVALQAAARPDQPAESDTADDVDRILMLLMYSHALDNAATLATIKGKLDGEGK